VVRAERRGTSVLYAISETLVLELCDLVGRRP